MRTTLQIDDDVLDSARELAVVNGRSLGSVISALARSALRPPGIVVVDGIPTFDVPADAQPISPEDVARGLDEE